MYLGFQHYRKGFNTDLNSQRARDEERRMKCKKSGITLIEIPYWWDLKKG